VALRACASPAEFDDADIVDAPWLRLDGGAPPRLPLPAAPPGRPASRPASEAGDAADAPSLL
jgi:hypothetical protein